MKTCSIPKGVVVVAAFIAVSMWGSLGFAAATETTPKSVAVMYFANRSPTGQWQWLSKGLTDMLITDLSVSSRLLVVERERLTEILGELELAKTGVVDSSTAGKVGRVAKVDWALFGSYLKKDDHLKMEAHLLDMKTYKLLRVEWVEGPAGEVLQLEKRLVQQFLERLDVPISEEEERSIMHIPTDSITAFEHYSRSLDFFDEGQWFDALLESRLAGRNDPNFIKARAHIAGLYAELGRYKHAIVEYQELVEADKENMLPEVLYYKMGRLLEDNLRDDERAEMAYMKILQRYPEYDEQYNAAVRPPGSFKQLPFDRTQRPKVQKNAAIHDMSFRSLERLALIKQKTGDDRESARLYSMIVYFMRDNGMEMYLPVLCADLKARVWRSYGALYWRLVRENRDQGLCPPENIFRIPADGYVFDWNTHDKHSNVLKLVAPTDKEIAKLSVTVNTDTAKSPSPRFQKVQIDFDCRDHRAMKQIKFGQGLQTADHEMKRGARSAYMIIFGTDSHPKIKMTLRPWSGEPDIDPFGSLAVHLDPPTSEPANLDGKLWLYRSRHPRSVMGFPHIPAGEHVMETRWPDGRTISKRFIIMPGKHKSIFLSAKLSMITRTRIGDPGSFTYVFVDRNGKIWLLWDQAATTYSGRRAQQPDRESDIYCSTSTDGLKWENPRRLSVSSSSLDMKPMIQQDRSGTYWLTWISSRDKEDPKWLWIASSSDGSKWSFPRKIKLSIANEDELSRWRKTPLPTFAFVIDRDDNFWIVWPGHLFRSEDTRKWPEAELLKTNPTKKPKHMLHRNYSLTCDQENNLVLINDYSWSGPRKDDPSKLTTVRGTAIWRRNGESGWSNLEFPQPSQFIQMYASIFSISPERLIIAFATSTVYLRTYDQGKGWSEKVLIESHVTSPLHPSVTALPDGRIAIACSTKDGIVVTVCKIP